MLTLREIKRVDTICQLGIDLMLFEILHVLNANAAFRR
jgi:hypothetical protein